MKYALSALSIGLVVLLILGFAAPQDDLKPIAKNLKELKDSVAQMNIKIDKMASALEMIIETTGLREAAERRKQQADDEKENPCKYHLSQLIKSMYNYTITRMSSVGSFPPYTGSTFWLALTEDSVRPAEVGDRSLFVCPSSGDTPGKGICSYRGPKAHLNEAADGAVAGCDKPENHPDGLWYVKKSGDVQWAKKDSKEYRQALESTSD